MTGKRSALACVGLLLAGCVAGCNVNKEIAEGCRNGDINGPRILEVWRDAGLIRSQRLSGNNGIYIEVDTRLWARAGRKVQISIGVAAYCQIVDAEGRGTAIVQGSTQEDLGSVVDGNWMR